MGKVILLKVKNKEVETTKVTYEDLLILYKQYIEKYGDVPVYSKCDSKHNMPQGRIINRILRENNVTYNDFLLRFGKVSHVRTESKDYDAFVNRFKEVSLNAGHGLKRAELINNSYGLPNPNWFIEYCPDKNVKSYDDFVKWCGFDSNVLKKDDFSVGLKLIELQDKLGRHITRNDITIKNVGFTSIVVNRIYGNLNNAKRELGLLKTPPCQPKPFEYYKDKLSSTLLNINKHTGRNFVSWADIENPLYGCEPCEHKTYLKSFRNENIDIFAYIKSQGFQMNPSNFSHRYTFDDGERVVSTLEFDFSTYLRKLGYIYNKTYKRDVLYRKFTKAKGKINCDYCLEVNDIKLYIEIAGIINSHQNSDWRTQIYSSKTEKDYQQKMIKKENFLIESGNKFLFLFKNDILNNTYKEILNNEILKIVKEVA